MAAPLEPLGLTDMALRLGAAMFVSGVIGLEREFGRHPAGMRTHMLVGIGAATFVMAGHELVAMIAPSTDAAANFSRILQGIITGIGFLGAGTVLHSGERVRGLTTAASIWATTALGLVCGMGLYRLALVAGVATLFTLSVLNWIERRFEHRDQPPPAPPPA